MTFAALCELVAYREWCIALSCANGGNTLTMRDEPARLTTLSIHESRGARIRHEPSLVSVRLDKPEITLDMAADAIGRTLQAAGVF